MAALPRARGQRLRRGSLERPINDRSYRGTWLLVAVPLLVAAFAVRSPDALPRAELPPSFDARGAAQLAAQLATLHPDRRPGSPGARRAGRWYAGQMSRLGLRPSSEPFSARVAGDGRMSFENIAATAPGRTPETIVVMAHRDNVGTGPGANDNASGTAALIELARSYANVPIPAGGHAGTRLRPAHTIRFLSTDGGSFGEAGARHFLERSPGLERVAVVINLDAVAGRSRPRLQLAGESPRSPPAALVRTTAARLLEQIGLEPERPSAFRQLLDLAFPFSVYEHAPFVARGVPALTMTTADDRPPDPALDTPRRLSRERLGQIGRATQLLVASLDQGLEIEEGTPSYLYVGSRIIPGWAIELVLIAALLPFAVAAVDLFARCRRRRIPLAPALRSYRSRLAVFLWIGVLFALFTVLGAWPNAPRHPPPLDGTAAGDWPVLALLALGALAAVGWLLARVRLLPRRPVSREEELAGYTAGLLSAGVAALLVAAANPFALLFVLPSLHAWLWLPQLRTRPAWVRAAVLLAGLAGPGLLLASFATRFDLGLDAPWYVAQLVAVGYVPIPLVVAFLAWAAAGAQLTALVSGRYAPYPSARERPPRGPAREVVRRVVLFARAQGRRRRRADPALTPPEAGDTGRVLRPAARRRRARPG